MTWSSNLGAVISDAQRLHPQFRFAAAVALTRAVRNARESMPAEVGRVFDRPSMFTSSGFFMTPARKDALQATVGVKDRQAQYLHWQVEGGARAPARQALRLPAVVQLDAHGNLPVGLIRSLVQRARAGKRATRTQARKFGLSQQLDLFYGEPGDGRPAGIYKRVALSATRQQLVPVVVFPKRAARYERRFDFHAAAEREVVRTFPAELDRAWREAVASAR